MGDFVNTTKAVDAAAPSLLAFLLFLRIMPMAVDGYLNMSYSISIQCLSTIFHFNAQSNSFSTFPTVSSALCHDVYSQYSQYSTVSGIPYVAASHPQCCSTSPAPHQCFSGGAGVTCLVRRWSPHSEQCFLCAGLCFSDLQLNHLFP